MRVAPTPPISNIDLTSFDMAGIDNGSHGYQWQPTKVDPRCTIHLFHAATTAATATAKTNKSLTTIEQHQPQQLATLT